MTMYRPLPPNVTIKNSNIDGLGLFAVEPIVSGTDLGMTHIFDERFEDGLIRLPMGGFFNHSKTPNCKVVEVLSPIHHLRLVVISNVNTGEELTAEYTMYDPTK